MLISAVTDHHSRLLNILVKYKPVSNVPIVKAAAASALNGKAYVLVLNQALYVRD
jgi:hypothetical protein